MRRRKVTYPPPKTATSGGKNANANPGADARAAAAASRTVSINLEAMAGRPEVVRGGRVQIASGLYAGELATVESIVGGVIPAAVVSTDAGRTRRVRTVDLIPVTGEAPKAGSERGAPGSIDPSAPLDQGATTSQNS